MKILRNEGDEFRYEARYAAYFHKLHVARYCHFRQKKKLNEITLTCVVSQNWQKTIIEYLSFRRLKKLQFFRKKISYFLFCNE